MYIPGCWHGLRLGKLCEEKVFTECRKVSGVRGGEQMSCFYRRLCEIWKGRVVFIRLIYISARHIIVCGGMVCGTR